MRRILCISALIYLQLSGCILQGNTPTVAEYFLEAMDWLGRENWRYFLPNDTDIDQDGRLSDLEIEYKFHSYLGELFKMIDQDKDNIVTEEEMRSLNLEIAELSDKVIDIAMENFPLKPILLAADANGDGFYDEDDFYLPENLIMELPKSLENTKVRLTVIGEASIPFYFYDPVHVGDNEGNVLCKSLGFEGLDFIGSGPGPLAYGKFSCQGTESRLEDCQLLKLNDSVAVGSVSCKGEPKLGSLHLVGGKDSSAGDIFLGNKGLNCVPHGPGWHDISEVICRQLGFPGFVKTTRGSAFTRNIYPHSVETLKKGFSCTGTETNITDCNWSQEGQNCDDYSIYGVVCKTDTRKGVEDALGDMIGWRWSRNSETWEKLGRILFIADSNADGKLTQDELKETAKVYMSGILDFFDQTHDGHISINDFTTIYFKVGPIRKILNLAFDVFADKTNDDIDLFEPNIAGKNLYQLIGFYPEDNNVNEDRKLTALDFYAHRYKYWGFLVPIINLKLDENQDGKTQRQELNQFIDDMFKQFDDDKSGEITLEDISRLMRRNGFNCYQTGIFKTYLTILFNQSRTQIGEFMSYLFEQFDLDKNKRVTIDEFEKMNVPCNLGRSGRDDDSRKICYRMPEFFFGAFGDVRFPDLEDFYDDQYGRPIKPKGEESSVDKLVNAACEIVT